MSSPRDNQKSMKRMESTRMGGVWMVIRSRYESRCTGMTCGRQQAARIGRPCPTDAWCAYFGVRVIQRLG